jgi:hypothetical protein
MIGYSIYSYANPSIESFEVTPQKQFNNKTKTAQKDTLVISNYRDPFLGKIINDKKKPIKKKVVITNFPAVVYHGLVKGNSVTSYIISVQNQQELLKVGQSLLDIKLISANTKRIIVEFKSTRKTIKLQQ